MSKLSTFVDSRCGRTGTCKLKDLLAAFRESLPDAERSAWTRSRLVIELSRAGYVLGESAGAVFVAGISLPADYAAVNGKLVKK